MGGDQEVPQDPAAEPPDPAGSDRPERPEESIRVGDAERHAVVNMLSRHTVAGRLTLDEFAERSGQVFSARTEAELNAVMEDLPSHVVDHPVAEADRVMGTGTQPEPLADSHEPRGRRRKKRRFVAVMSGTKARGRWWAPHKIRAFAWWGGVVIDLREAVISSPVVDIRASAYMGQIKVIVPEGIPVDMRGFVLMGGASNRTGAAEPLPSAPMVRVRARGLWGGVAVRSRPQRTVPDGSSERGGGPHRGRSRRSSRYGPPGQRYRYGHRHEGRRDRPPWSRWGDSDGDRGARPNSAAGAAASQGPAGALPMASLHDVLPALDGLPQAAKLRLGEKLRAAAERMEGDGAHDLAAPASGGAGPEASSNGSRLPVGTMTMLVTDIVGSTQLAGQMGDRRWIDVLRVHNQLIRSQVADHGGTEVKAQGDGFLMAFPSARRAILAAVEIQRAMATYRSEHAETPIDLRVGLHTGEVVVDGEDIHGQNVVVAVRIAEAARPNEILVSGMTRDLAVSAGDITFGTGRELSLKGLEECRRVHDVSWV